MTNLILPTPEQWAVLEELGLTDNAGGINVVIHPDAAAQAERDGIDLHKAARGYDCGGDPDIWFDVVDDREHYFFTRLED